ncbi:potassium channel family protein [Vibrio furnissii]|uniref:potassium channel family protein n=1 Tax=Vibrio furnissii TaxID=29494 RepID=UPI001EEB8C58|nr:potassium channel family protein [Vibrio furnissii]EIZ9933159.1 two pore domain potassium channel family protein [Vibrio parahaemolyticus]MCG6231576.1 potassium channel family protein [Vibrio furnissii]MCG6258764.1 potassium channel family protein [Vibrio furnissii]
MEILNNILKELKITDSNSLREYISKNYGKASKLKIYKSSDLGVDSEDRIFEDVINLQYAIIDVPRIDLSNSSNISFQDCVFTGDVRIGNRERKNLSVFFNHVCIDGYLSISGVECNKEVSLSSVIAKEIRVINSEISSFRLWTSKTSSLKFQSSSIGDYSSLSNELGFIQKYQTNINNSTSSGDQIKLSSQLKSDKELEEDYNNFNALKYPEEADYRQLSSSEKKSSISETLEFIFKNNASKLNHGQQSKIKYLKGLNNLENGFQKFIYWAFGGLIRPSFILMMMLLVVVLFGAIFANFGLYNASCLDGSDSCAPRALEFWEALYYSGISFTTIGYGDIYPVSSIRYLAILEGVLGVLLSSCFVVSVTRKYIE